MVNQPTAGPVLITPPSKELKRRRLVWQIVLGLFSVFLVFRAWQVRTTPFEQVDLAFQSASEVGAWLSGLLFRELRVLGFAFVLGLLVPPALFGPTTMIEDRSRRWIVRAGWWGFGLVMIALCFWIAWEEFPPLGTLLLPFMLFLLGVRLSSAGQRGAKPLAWAGGQIALAAVLLIGIGFSVLGNTVSDSALDIDAADISTADKRLLADRIRDSRPAEGQPRKVQFSDGEINAIANSVLNRGNSGHKASVHFEPSAFAAQASLALPRRFGEGKYLNVRALGHLSIDEGDFDFGFRELQVGSVNVPGPLVHMLSGSVHAMLMEDPQIQRITEAVEKLKTDDSSIFMQFQPGAVGRQMVPAMVQLLWKQPDVADETRVYVQHLISVFEKAPKDTDRFGLMFQAAFKLAAERSANHDPVLENRAAIFALAILLGHQELEPFVGEVFDDDTRAKGAKMVNSVEMRGRQDLPRHFMVSAALALLAGEAVSDRIGVMKEQIDSKQGGTGFSFVDMLANMSGTRLAVAATKDAVGARTAQVNLSRKFDVDSVFPKIDGLPEGIPSDDFQKTYGGVGGIGYEAQMSEIKRRIDALPKL